MENAYRCSFLQFDITPNITEENPAYLQGIYGVHRPSTEIESPLNLHMLLVEDINYTKILIVSADIFGFDASVVKVVRERAAYWGIRPEGIVLNASHTHYAPGTLSNILTSMGPFYPSYTDQIVKMITHNMEKLYRTLEPCCIHIGIAEARIGANRRKRIDGKISFAPNITGPYITETPVLKFELSKSKKKVVLVNHGCHPTGLGTGLHADRRVSAGFPGYLREALIKNGAADGVMFLQGAAGSSKETVGVGDNIQFCTTNRDSRKNGNTLARCVIRALEDNLQPLMGSLFCRCHSVDLPIQRAPSLDMLKEIIADTNGDIGLKEWAERQLKKSPKAEFSTTVPMEVQLVAFGDNFNMCTLPAEPTAELALIFRDQKVISNNDFLLGYTNGLRGYLPTNEMIAQGGYEVEQSHLIYQQPAAFDKGVEDVLLQALKAGNERKLKPNLPNGYGRYHLATGKKEAFFVLSPGRCGTMTLAHILDTASNAKVWHHPQPDPIKEALMAWWKEIDRSQSFWRARAPMIYDSWANDKIHGETDLLMTPFCDVIADEIPDAKFIILVRDPRDFVRSGMRRNYYKGHSWDFGRLRPQENTAEFGNWHAMDQFEKICWLWTATYKEIQKRTRSIQNGNIIILRFEDFINDPDRLEPVFEFLGIEGFDKASITTLLSKKMNKQQSGNFPKKEEWPENLHKKLWKLCGEVAESYGYQYKCLNDDRKKPPQTTIWDYMKYDHQSYPENLSVDIVLEGPKPGLQIDQTTRIVSMGSCFARNIALELMRRQYNYIITELPFSEYSAHWGQVFNTACMRQIFEYTFRDRWDPTCRWWPKGDNVQDPFRRNILYERKNCEEAFAAHRSASSQALKGADVFILTLGLIETWRDRRDGMTYYRVPSPAVFDEDLHEFHVQDLEECVHDLTVVQKILKENNPECKLIVSVSPVPLFATFRKDTDVVSANSFSKATLRVAAENFCRQHKNAFYFPSYEIVTQILDNPWESDGRHVTKNAIREIIDAFLRYFSG